MSEVTCCAYGHLIFTGQECMQCALEIRAAKILNLGFEEWKMNQAFEELEHFCNNCTARKLEGWAYCPFCGGTSHYHTGVNGQRVDGHGVVRQTKQTVNECSMAEAGGIQTPFSSEEEHFNTAINVVRKTFDKVKLVRKSRDRAERDLRTAIQKIEALQAQLPEGMKHCTIITEECPVGHTSMRATNWVKHECSTCEANRLRAQIEGLLKDLDQARRQRPEPLHIGQVLGRHSDGLLEALPLIEIHQDVGQGCVITVGLRK